MTAGGDTQRTPEEEDDKEMVEVNAVVVRRVCGILKDNAAIHYKANNTQTADQLHRLARKLNDEIGDDWKDVGELDLQEASDE